MCHFQIDAVVEPEPEAVAEVAAEEEAVEVVAVAEQQETQPAAASGEWIALFEYEAGGDDEVRNVRDSCNACFNMFQVAFAE